METTSTDHNGATSRILPLSIQERNGQITIYCDGEHCVWSWRLYDDLPEANRRAITSAIGHVRKRHPEPIASYAARSENSNDR